MFPLADFPRARRVTIGGLPPPVPTPAIMEPPTQLAARSTWRSLSPFRAEGNKRLSTSPILRPRAGSNVEEMMVYVSPSARSGGGSAVNHSLAGIQKGRTLAPLPPPAWAAKQERKISKDSASLARLGKTVSLPIPGKVEKYWLSTGPPGPAVDFPPANATTTASQWNQEPALFSTGGQNMGGLEAAASITPSTVEPFNARRSSPFGADGVGEELVISSSETAPYLSVVADALPPSPRESTAYQTVVVPPEATPLWSCGPSDVSANAETQRSCPSPPTIRENTDQGWLAALSEAAPSEAIKQGPSSSELSEAGASIDKVSVVVPQQDGGSSSNGGGIKWDSVVSIGNDGASNNKVCHAQALPPPPLSSALFGQSVEDFGVTARPSPFVNTSSPLTGGRKGGLDTSLFGPDAAESDDGNVSTASGAADLFASHAPVRAADELFCSQDPVLAEATPSAAPGQQSLGDGGKGGNTNNANLFLESPPPETPIEPPPSLPNPWGSSPIKQPLPEPRRWPTKAGTGFDRPQKNTKNPAREINSFSSRGAGAIPAAFFGAVENENDNFGVENGGEGETESKPFQGAPAPSFLPAASPTGFATAKPFEGGNSDGSFDAARANTLTPAVVKPTVGRYGHAASFKGFNGQHSGTGWGAGGMAAGTASTECYPREQGVRPPGVIAAFGFGGRLVCMHPRRKMRLAPVPGVVPSPDDGPALRNGPVKVRKRRYTSYCLWCGGSGEERGGREGKRAVVDPAAFLRKYRPYFMYCGLTEIRRCERYRQIGGGGKGAGLQKYSRNEPKKRFMNRYGMSISLGPCPMLTGVFAPSQHS